MSKERTTVWLESETIEMLDATVEEAARDPEIGDEVSRAMLIRHLINLGIDHWDGELRDLVPDSLLEKWRIKKRKERRKNEDYKNKLAAYWRQNVNRQFTKFYDDEAPARPEKVRVSMEKYREEAHDVYDDEEALAEDLEWLDRKLDQYEEAVEYAETVPDRGFERVSPEVSVGADLNQLRHDAIDIVEDIETLADGQAFDPDAIRDRLASDYGVSTDAIDEFLDAIVRDDIDVERALKGKHGEDGPERFREVVDPRALGTGSSLSELPSTEATDSVEVESETEAEVEVVETTDTDDRRQDDLEELVDDAAARLDAASYPDLDAIAAAVATEHDVDEDTATEAVEKANSRQTVKATPDGGDHAGGLSPEDLAREEVIEEAVDLLRSDIEASQVELELRSIATSENERNAALAVARERLDRTDDDTPSSGPAELTPAVTDGGEADV